MIDHGIYTTDEGLDVYYSVWEDKGDRLQPPFVEVEIRKIEYNNIDVTELIFSISSDYIDTLIENIQNG